MTSGRRHLGKTVGPEAIVTPPEGGLSSGSDDTSAPLNSGRRARSALSALAPSSQKPLRHESQVEEEANAQAEAQKKEDEAEVQVSRSCAPVRATGAGMREPEAGRAGGLRACCLARLRGSWNIRARHLSAEPF
ncbi:uncharacterized protein LOC102437719 [Myotis lucifugus]|uniref:uncharacterized protein LOC102437719 n=1 Tax=Myotis lucifugus TaxID=59463 RepID=UPI000CCC2E60|nr:uncharacterized protein LOC102437719 [Myotis lucifugus]